MTYLVYHGAEHTRFGHSLGVMHQASRVFDALVNKNQAMLGWPADKIDRLRQLLRLASLCHDLGHCPFSHAGEGEAGEELLAGNLRHEDYSAEIVLAKEGRAGEIRQVIEGRAPELQNVSPDEIAALIKEEALGESAFLQQILSGELDADRMDYLQRDSIYCGVRYGRFDNDRLIETLTVSKEPLGENFVIAIEEDGVPAAEGLILARYSMFLQVYFHKVRRAYDYHLRTFLKSALGATGCYPGPEDLDSFLAFDDQKVCRMFEEHGGRGGKAGEHATRIVKRNHYRVAKQTSQVVTQRQITKWDSQLFPQVQHGFPGAVANDRPETAAQRFEELPKEFPVVPKDPSSRVKAIEDASALIPRLQALTIRRLLADKDKCDDVRRFCESLNLDVS